MEILIVALFSFTTIFFSLTISVIGLINNKYWFLTIGAILYFLFCYYWNDAEDFRGVIFLPLFHLGSALAIYKNKNILAWLFFLPSIVFTVLILGYFL